jgi:AraC-like DNA-binding protein/HD-like signal output (HDOD) protein
MNDSKPTLLLTTAVNNLLQKCELPATLSIEQCASSLAMSMTSFRRKLAKEETSFKLIQSKFLNEFCVEALLTEYSKIEDLAIKLGYSERATFERAFRQKFGVTPSQFRDLSQVGSADSSYQKLTEIAKNMPPMPGSCRMLLEEREQGSLDLQRVIDIISHDAIFSARIMGQASKAIYGKTPKNLLEAVSRNIGINSVVNFAIIYAVKDTLQEHVEQPVIDQFCEAFLIAPKVFQQVRKLLTSKVKFDIALTEQVLVFALLGVLLLSHKSNYKHELMLYSMQGTDDLDSLNRQIRKSMAISIFSSSSLMLSLWHIDASLVKQLSHLEKVSQLKVKGSEQDELVIFMLSCLYFSAAGHSDFSALEQKAELLNISDFDEIKAFFIKES